MKIFITLGPDIQRDYSFKFLSEPSATAIFYVRVQQRQSADSVQVRLSLLAARRCGVPKSHVPAHMLWVLVGRYFQLGPSIN